MYPDDRSETMVAQTRAWKKESHHFDLLGRYEARLSRQLLQYQKELERLQAVRKAEEKETASRQSEETQPVNPEMGSFGTTPSTMIMQAPATVAQALVSTPAQPEETRYAPAA